METKQIINKYSQLIHNYIQQEYLNRCIPKPTIEEHKILALYSLVKDKHLHEEYIVSALLVQLALNTHDTINKKSHSNSSKNIKRQQLTVLAGDYYSGIYYHLLAKAKEVKFIKELASAIFEITEKKATLYYSTYSLFDQLLEAYIEVDTAIVNKVARYLQIDKGLDYMNDWLLLHKLIIEYKLVKEEKESFFQLLTTQNCTQVTTLVELEHCIHNKIIQLREKLHNYDQDVSKEIDFLRNMYHQDTKEIVIVNSLLEEGLSK